MDTCLTLRRARPTVAWRRWVVAGAASALLALTACGGSDDAVDRGPTTVSVAAKLNGLYWDATESRLYLSDDAGQHPHRAGRLMD